MELSVLVTWLVLIGLLYMGLFVIPAVRLRRAIFQVIDIFKSQGAACYTGIKTVHELGLGARSVMDNLFRTRDFKPYALQVLIHEGVIYATPNAQVCLHEEKIPEFLQKYRLGEKGRVSQ